VEGFSIFPLGVYIGYIGRRRGSHLGFPVGLHCLRCQSTTGVKKEVQIEMMRFQFELGSGEAHCGKRRYSIETHATPWERSHWTWLKPISLEEPTVNPPPWMKLSEWVLRGTNDR
jgi:hypothetical protein